MSGITFDEYPWVNPALFVPFDYSVRDCDGTDLMSGLLHEACNRLLRNNPTFVDIETEPGALTIANIGSAGSLTIDDRYPKNAKDCVLDLCAHWRGSYLHLKYREEP